MPGRRTNVTFVTRDEDEVDEASTSEEEGEEEEEEEDYATEVSVQASLPSSSVQPDSVRPAAGRPKISLSLKPRCKVCKSDRHVAGFQGSVYLDCPNKPCYLCKRPGHTTATCPHKVAPEHGAIPATRRQAGSLASILTQREVRGVTGTVKRMGVIPKRVDAALLKVHSRRVTAIEYHPTKDNIVISGDKKGQLCIWDFQKVFDKTIYNNVHHYSVSSIRFDANDSISVYTSSLDGKLCVTDIETGFEETLADINPMGWQGDHASWRSFYAMDVNSHRGLILAGDDIGNLHRLVVSTECDVRVDTRAKKSLSGVEYLHKKATKVTSLHCNPVAPDLLISGGNDHTAQIWDLRRLEGGESITVLQHPRVVNSIYFSPVSGQKILSTCQDNRIRVWDYIHGCLSEPSREIVHSHDFNRYLTAFRAEWDPKDPSESLIVCGRYISDDFNGVALHPVDFIDASTGALVGELVDPNLTTICPVNKPHPRLDLMISGSSRSLFLWRPVDENKEELRETPFQIQLYNADEGGGRKGGKGKKKKGEEDDDDDDDEEMPKKKGGKGWAKKKVVEEVITLNVVGKGKGKEKVKEEWDGRHNGKGKLSNESKGSECIKGGKTKEYGEEEAEEERVEEENKNSVVVLRKCRTRKLVQMEIGVNNVKDDDGKIHDVESGDVENVDGGVSPSRHEGETNNRKNSLTSTNGKSRGGKRVTIDRRVKARTSQKADNVVKRGKRGRGKKKVDEEEEEEEEDEEDKDEDEDTADEGSDDDYKPKKTKQGR